MKASPEDQLRLLVLADADVAIARARHRRAELPEVAQLRELGAQRNAVTAELVAAETQLGDLVAEQEQLEGDLEPARARLVRNQGRVDAGEIGDPKALRSMLEEIEHLKGRISKLEDAELDLMQSIEDTTAVCDEIAARRGVIDNQARGLIAARDSAFAEIDAELVELGNDRQAQAVVVPDELLAMYEKIAARWGTGAAKLTDGRCMGCHVEANAADLRQYSAASPDQVVRCEECGRILVR
ncbi:zinc ribbon domain-containing protein [Aestuariimicrobium sp. Y1814]|uniref:zinc ribbon domain-containing protein n=1 Tax=Aestuariimicrobium sp. Y1814 TaxID=3418742 RepID=UPI003DA75E75